MVISTFQVIGLNQNKFSGVSDFISSVSSSLGKSPEDVVQARKSFDPLSPADSERGVGS